MTAHGFVPLITRATRLAATTLIDHIWFRAPPAAPTPLQHISTKILLNKFSDHQACVASLEILNATFELPKFVEKRNFSERNISNFCQDFESANVPAKIGPSLNRDPNVTYGAFYETFSSIRDKHMPLVRKKFNRKRDKVNNWITQGLIKSVAKKNRLYVAFRKATPGTASFTRKKEDLKEYESVLKQVITLAKAQYYEKQFKTYINDIKGTWAQIKKLLNKNRKISKLPSTFTKDGNEYKNPEDIANGFNNFYANLGPKLAREINTEGKAPFSSYLGRPPPCNFAFNFTDAEKITRS